MLKPVEKKSCPVFISKNNILSGVNEGQTRQMQVTELIVWFLWHDD